MNAVFLIISFISALIIAIKFPSKLLDAFTSSSEKAITLSFTLLGIYAVWLGFTELLKSLELDKKLAKALKKPLKFLFNTNSPDALNAISLSLACNMLGIGGVATPSAIDGMKFLDEEGNEKGKTMLIVISSTSIQILPITVMQLLSSYGATNPASIFLPTLISTVLSTFIGVAITKLFV